MAHPYACSGESSAIKLFSVEIVCIVMFKPRLSSTTVILVWSVDYTVTHKRHHGARDDGHMMRMLHVAHVMARTRMYCAQGVLRQRTNLAAAVRRRRAVITLSQP